MTLLRRAPREVYRVYGAEEFLAGVDDHEIDDTPLAQDDASPPLRRSAPRAGERAARTLSAAVLIAGAGAACGLIIARNMPSAVHAVRHGPSGHAMRGSARPATFGLAAAEPSVRPTRPLRHRVGGHRRVRPPLAPAVAVNPTAASGTRAARSLRPTSARLGAPQPAAHLEFGFER